MNFLHRRPSTGLDLLVYWIKKCTFGLDNLPDSVRDVASCNNVIVRQLFIFKNGKQFEADVHHARDLLEKTQPLWMREICECLHIRVHDHVEALYAQNNCLSLNSIHIDSLLVLSFNFWERSSQDEIEHLCNDFDSNLCKYLLQVLRGFNL